MATATKNQTMHIDYTDAPIIRCVARKTFTFNGEQILKDAVFFLVRSSKNNGEYHLVHWRYDMYCWQCSCVACRKVHSHITKVNVWIATHVHPCKGEVKTATADKVAEQYKAQAVRSSSQPVVSAPVAKKWENAPLNGNGEFSILKKSA